MKKNPNDLLNSLYSNSFFKKIKRYIKHRYITKTHALTSHLKKGVFHELDDRILYCLFDELIYFIETEFSYEYYLFFTDNRKKYQTVLNMFKLKLGLWRCHQAGLDYLNWAASLNSDGNNEAPCVGKEKVIAAREILVLYQWWMNERPNRKYTENDSVADKYFDEDTEMLIRLIKIRDSLWT